MELKRSASNSSNAGTGNFFVCDGCDGPDADIINSGPCRFMVIASAYHCGPGVADATRLAKQWNIYGPDWVV